MKRVIILALMLALAISLSAGGLRSYIQMLVNDKDGGRLENVENVGFTHSPDYHLTAYITARPKEVVSTDSTLATLYSPANYIRVSKIGNGAKFPYTTTAYLQLIAFSTPWNEGETIRLTLSYIPTGEDVTWDLVIPDDTNNNIGFGQKYNPIEQIIAPPFSKKE